MTYPQAAGTECLTVPEIFTIVPGHLQFHEFQCVEGSLENTREIVVNIAIQIIAANGRMGQDRACVFPASGGYVFVLADGAGGVGGGDLAADAVVDAARSCALISPESCVATLEDLDIRLMSIGQTTAIFACIAAGHIWGASVGDSSAWMISPSNLVDLTSDQIRKPLAGTGAARPVMFGPRPFFGRLLIGSDGLFKYVSEARIRQLSSTQSLESLPEALVEAARIRSGALHDDIAVIVAE